MVIFPRMVNFDSRVRQCYAAICISPSLMQLFFVDHAGNKIDEVWRPISRRGVVGTGQNFAGS